VDAVYVEVQIFYPEQPGSPAAAGFGLARFDVVRFGSVGFDAVMFGSVGFEIVDIETIRP